MSRAIHILVAALFCAPLAAQAVVSYGDTFFAQDLKLLCSTESEKKDSCISFIKGVRAGATGQRLVLKFQYGSDNVAITPEIGHRLAIEPFCLPEGITDTAMAEVVIEYLNSLSTDQMKASAGFVVLMALATKHPCKRADYEALDKKGK